MANVGFIGTGEIAAAMVRGLAGQGHSITVSKRNAAVAAELSNTCAEVSVADNQQVLDRSDIIFLCLLQPVAEVALPMLTFSSRHRLVSVMVDVPMARFQTLCSGAAGYAITIPLPMIAVGGCPLPVFGDLSAVTELFSRNNLILRQESEDALNAHFAASALGSVVLDQLLTSTNWLAGVTGDQAASETYLVRMIAGYLNGFADGQSGQLEEALKALSTEGGLNATLRGIVADGSALSDIVEGLDGFRGRLGLPPVK